MKHSIVIIILFITFNSSAQLEFGNNAAMSFSNYHEATLKLRNGEILMGKAKITNEEEVKLKNEDGKSTYNYRDLESFEMKQDGEVAYYKYKIIGGREPRLMLIMQENENGIHLYKIAYKHNLNPANASPNLNAASMPVISTPGPTLTVNEYYINKNGGHEVIQLGNDHPVFGKGKFKRNAIKFFKDCPDLVKKIKDNSYKRNEIESMVAFYQKNCRS